MDDVQLIMIIVLGVLIGAIIEVVKFSFRTCRKMIHMIAYKIMFFSFAKETSAQEFITKLTPREFEYLCAELLKFNRDYETYVTQATADGGKDIVVTTQNGETGYVECKYYGDNSIIGREIIQKLAGSMLIDGADFCILMTTGTLNDNAKECIEKLSNIEVINKENILEMYTNLTEHEEKQLQFNIKYSENLAINIS